ncbi:GCN5-related N-acetyltransferase [Cordyceps fumosorosea ARSEF 2679]|uniref:GCN5-related N-acetyltransferase n=1 Tax=Cordyceps fumosorosea (strain ARSEF 2679) TaxID=1081104 RepID=A0A167NVY9_CORFA|nr:GCN5-related N-acetyltransferase [Cordyceps fumosorosea ARSEF 2679]OAA55999.1 GCN5-related N-acetyltransferase [Cordyceps fumosorosea ARSEF 2679]
MTVQSPTQITDRLSFRRASLADVAQVRALVVSAFRGASSLAGWTTEAHLFTDERISKAGLVAKIQHPGTQVIMALDEGDGGALLGCAEIVAADAAVQIGMVAVVPEIQNRGIGKALIAHLEEVARREYGARSAEMCVIASREDVIGFYGRRGYVKTERTKPFPYDLLVNGKALHDDLYFVVLEKTLSKQ